MRYITLMLAILIFSCEDDIPGETTTIVGTINSGDTYVYEISQGVPIEGGYSIVRQAEHAKRSEIVVEEGVSYEYEPEDGFTGKEIIIIEDCMSAGGPDCVQIDKLRFEITVN